jgi:hypothetical protein
VQALLPFVVGLYEYASSRRNPALWFVWQLPSSTEEQRTAHAKLTALCHSEVVTRTITAHQEKQLAALCRNPVQQLSKPTVTFLLREEFGMGACGSFEKEKRIKALVDDPQTAEERRRVESLSGQEQAHGTLVRSTPLLPSMRALHAICS